MKTVDIEKAWNNYWAWLFKLPDAIGIFLAIITVLIPATIISFSIIITIEFFARAKCLDSQLSRRWDRSICEEYHDGEWAEVNSDNIYFYNDEGERISQ